MFKMGLHDPFQYLKQKLWLNETSRIKMPMWLSTTKSWESPWFTYVKVACHTLLKVLDKGYNFVSDLTSIENLHKKLWATKMARVPISGLTSWESKTKWHLGATFVTKYKEYYKKERGGFPQVWATENLVSLCMLLVHPCTKSASIMH
jgi:hypothetical protein